MKDQRGVTLIELLLAITILVVVLAPITTLLTMFLKTNHEVVTQNDLQHEARFILEYMSEHMKNGAVWEEVVTNEVFQLQHPLQTEVYMIYNKRQALVSDGTGEGSYTFSNHVHSLFLIHDEEKAVTDIYIHLKAHDEEYKLKTKITYNRF